MQSTLATTPLKLFSRVLPRASSSASISRRFSPAATTSFATSTHLNRPFSNSTTNKMADKLTFLDAVKHRRTIYGLEKKSSVSDARIREIVEQVVTDVPSSFNSQSSRLVVLVKEEHDKFWDVVTNILKGVVPEDSWEHTKQRMDMFRGAYGTVLFYEDPAPVKALQEKLPLYADKFPQWSEHTSAMHQYALWTALEAEGLGANLQHYNPLPDQKVAEIWGIPLEWSHKAQLVFGDPKDAKREQLQAKDQKPLEEKLKFFGA